MSRSDLTSADTDSPLVVRFISVWESARVASKAKLDLKTGVVSDIEEVDCETGDDILVHEEIEFEPTTHPAMATMTENDHLIVEYDEDACAYRLDSLSHDIVLAAWRTASLGSASPHELTNDRAPISASAHRAAPNAATPG